MRISFKCDYALKAILDLALNYNRGKTQIRDIARRQDIPIKYLSQILLILKGTGYLRSHRGPNGGYWLAKAPQEITIGEIVRLIDGPTSPIGCVSQSGYTRCDDEPICPFRDIWVKIRACTNEIIDHTTFAEIREIAKRKKIQSALTYHI